MNIGVLISKDYKPLKLFKAEIVKSNFEVNLKIVISNYSNGEDVKDQNKKELDYFEILRSDYRSRLEHERAILEKLNNRKISYLILIDYSRILSPLFIKNANFAIMNMHSSLLPAFNGIYPEKQALEYGAKITGLTTHLLHEDLDYYEIIEQIPIKINKDDNITSLKNKIDKFKGKILVSSLKILKTDEKKKETI